MNEQEITHLEHVFILESATGKWTDAQVKAVRAFCKRLRDELAFKLAKEAAG